MCNLWVKVCWSIEEMTRVGRKSMFVLVLLVASGLLISHHHVLADEKIVEASY